MNKFMLASMLMSLAVVSLCMIWSQHRENHGKQSLANLALSWLLNRLP
ncbi:hypothetical protein SAMN04487951_101359 [Vreelandella arcis]|uniref:Uncharacterized protein n=1 Tax=Vreelandella arcis TaxID=416873 RepID=A0A1G9XNL5_9GAMM|nr:hypothetical protein SAMN04487951_101359 [Halomonas arcis]